MENPAIAIDVDGVLVEQVAPVLQIINKRYRISLLKEDITSWGFQIEDTNIKAEIELAEKDEDFVTSMIPLEGAVAAVSDLFTRFRIVIATSRDPLTDSWTRKWLDANGIKYHHFINTRVNGKGLLEARVLIDDYIENIKAFITSGDDSRKAILFSQPWNLNHHELMRFILARRVQVAADWDDAVSSIRQVR